MTFLLCVDSKSPHLHLAKRYWTEHLSSGDVAIDATCGNGHDTFFLSTLPGITVFALDIQKEALGKTRNRVSSEVTLLHMSHALIHEIALPKAPRLIVYNLGYLPGGDKSITTQSETTLQSIQISLGLLAPGGALSITCYPGHEEGAREEKQVTEFLSTLSPLKWQICQHQFINRPSSPVFIWVKQLNVASSTHEQPREICGFNAP